MDVLYRIFRERDENPWINRTSKARDDDIHLAIHTGKGDTLYLLKLEGSSIRVVYVEYPKYFVIAGRKDAINRRKGILEVNNIGFTTIPIDFSANCDYESLSNSRCVKKLRNNRRGIFSRLFSAIWSICPESSSYRFVAETNLPTSSGTFRVRSYKKSCRTATFPDALAIISGVVEGKTSVLVRVHDQCATSEVFGSLKCDCKDQLDHALEAIRDGYCGIVIYLQQEGRGIGLANKIAAYGIQELGVDTVDANRILGLPDDSRQYDAVDDILDDLNVRSIRLMTNNPRKIERLTSLGIKVDARVPCVVTPNSHFSCRYVSTKAERMGHMIHEKCD